MFWNVVENELKIYIKMLTSYQLLVHMGCDSRTKFWAQLKQFAPLYPSSHCIKRVHRRSGSANFVVYASISFLVQKCSCICFAASSWLCQRCRVLSAQTWLISYYQVSVRRTRSFNGSLCTATHFGLWYGFVH